VDRPGGDVLVPLLERPDRLLVALDFDGVLAPIVARPEDAEPLPETVEVLTRLAPLVGRVAIVTGRPAGDAAARGALATVPGLVVLGHYGLERWEGGKLRTPPDDERVERLRAVLTRVVDDSPAGTRLEDKGHSVAVHTRGTADPVGALAAVLGPVAAAAAAEGLELVPGRNVVEVRPPGTDKGVALTDLVAEVGAAAVLYAGDDLGDLPALAALRALSGRGLHVVVVCSDSPETPAALREGADLVVDGPAGVLGVLRELLERLEFRG
jgi:trehalose 6-phosphate phosphatase